MADSDDALTLSRAFIDALNRGDRAEARSLPAEDVTHRESLEDEATTGPEAAIASIWSRRNSFPDLRIEVVDAFAAGGRAAVEFIATGTLEPCTYGENATPLTRRGCSIVAVRNA